MEMPHCQAMSWQVVAEPTLLNSLQPLTMPGVSGVGVGIGGRVVSEEVLLVVVALVEVEVGAVVVDDVDVVQSFV